MKWADKLVRGNWSIASWQKHENYMRFAFQGHERVLVVGFDHERSSKPVDNWQPWGSSFAFRNNFHYIGFATHISDWYLGDWMRTQMDEIAANRGEYDKILMTGYSMGGYAALTFSSRIPGSYVAAFSPQSTLDPATIDFDNRFPDAQRLDWEQSDMDVGMLRRDKSNCFAFYDPYLSEDRQHMARLDPSSVTLLRTRQSRQRSMLYLNKMGILQEVVQRILDDDLTEQTFYQLMRNRRVMRWYHNDIVEYLTENNHAEWVPAFQAAFKANAEANPDNRNQPSAKNEL